jgi:hypothetical protein
VAGEVGAADDEGGTAGGRKAMPFRNAPTCEVGGAGIRKTTPCWCTPVAADGEVGGGGVRKTTPFRNASPSRPTVREAAPASERRCLSGTRPRAPASRPTVREAASATGGRRLACTRPREPPWQPTAREAAEEASEIAGKTMGEAAVGQGADAPGGTKPGARPPPRPRIGASLPP